jgi:MFS family permease
MVDFNLTHSMGGFLYALPILMIALFSYPLGIFSDRIGMEASIGYGATIAILSSLLRSFTTSLPKPFVLHSSRQGDRTWLAVRLLARLW